METLNTGVFETCGGGGATELEELASPRLSPLPFTIGTGGGGGSEDEEEADMKWGELPNEGPEGS